MTCHNNIYFYLCCIAFDVNHVDIDILIPFVPIAGDVFSFTCRIGVPDRFVENITSIKWTYDLGSSHDVTGGNSNATVTPFTRVGGTFYSILTLNPVRTTDARPYYCHATILIFGTVDRTNRDLTVQSNNNISKLQFTLYQFSISSRCITNC